MNKQTIGILIISLVVGMFFLPQLVKSQGEPTDVEVLVSPFGLNTNGDPYDGKVLISLVVASAPTYAYSGAQEKVYLHKVVVDINKPAKIDDKIGESIWTEELSNNRNVTKIFWVDGRRIYRSGN